MGARNDTPIGAAARDATSTRRHTLPVSQMEPCDVHYPRAHRHGSRAWVACLGGRAPDDIAFGLAKRIGR
jgi:hypothetical protein